MFTYTASERTAGERVVPAAGRAVRKSSRLNITLARADGPSLCQGGLVTVIQDADILISLH